MILLSAGQCKAASPAPCGWEKRNVSALPVISVLLEITLEVYLFFFSPGLMQKSVLRTLAGKNPAHAFHPAALPTCPQSRGGDVPNLHQNLLGWAGKFFSSLGPVPMTGK